MSQTFDAVPVIDVSDGIGSNAPDPAFAEAFTDICHTVGFAVVTDHGVPVELIDEVFDLMHRFFALDDTDKARIAKTTSPQFRGWEPVGAETTDNKPDQREQIDVWSEWPTADPTAPIHHRLHGPNQWLSDDILPGHRDISLRWIAALGKLADELMAALSVGLGLRAAHLRELFGEQPMSLAKFIHYPPTPADAAGVNPHHDAGFLTVLAAGPTPGLQVHNPEGRWIDVPPRPDAFVINLGELMQAMTGNYLVATPHRVITREERWSAGYFHGPSLDMVLSPLTLDRRFVDAVEASPRHSGASYMPTPDEAQAGSRAMSSDHRPDTYGEQLWNYFTRSYGDLMAAHHPDAMSNA